MQVEHAAHTNLPLEGKHSCHQWEQGADPRNKTLYRGKASTVHEQQWDHIFNYFGQCHEEDHIISVRMLAIDLCHVPSAYADVPSHVLEQCIHWFPCGENIVSHHVIQISQNTRYNQEVMAEWIGIMNETIVASKYSPCNIINIDETNIYFDTTTASKLKGSRQAYSRIQDLLNSVQLF